MQINIWVLVKLSLKPFACRDKRVTMSDKLTISRASSPFFCVEFVVASSSRLCSWVCFEKQPPRRVARGMISHGWNLLSLSLLSLLFLPFQNGDSETKFCEMSYLNRPAFNSKTLPTMEIFLGYYFRQILFSRTQESDKTGHNFRGIL